MTLAEAEDAAKTRWLEEWTAFDPDELTGFDNETFAPPVDGTAFARFTVPTLPDAGATLGGIGARRVTRRGFVLLQLLSPQDVGRAAHRALVMAARALYERVSVGDLHFEEVDVKASRNDGRWYSTRLDCPFHYTETV